MATQLKVTLRNVEDELNRVKREVERQIGREMASDAYKTLRDLHDATPVDTGRAREGWNLVFDDRNPLFSLNRLNRGVREARLSFENDVDYIEDLNGGSSRQAPPRFIERVILRRYDPQGAIVRRR